VLNIRFPGKNEYQISILNSQGQKVLEGTEIGDSRMNIKNLNPGNYIVILNADGVIWQEKFLKL
jgi:hypothetical protein